MRVGKFIEFPLLVPDDRRMAVNKNIWIESHADLIEGLEVPLYRIITVQVVNTLRS